MVNGQSTNSLMWHIRNNHGITIYGSKHKKYLLRMGYYHGYKGYRFYKSRQNLFNFSNFDEIVAIYNFDTALKDLLFSPLVSCETHIKNYILGELVSNSDPIFEDIYINKLTDCMHFASNQRTDMLKKRLNLQKNVHTSIHMNYNKNKMVTNKINSGDQIPLWIVFEILSFGKLGDFVEQMHRDYRKNVLNILGIYDAMDTNASHLTNHIFILNELRNAIAHNHIIFDTRFKKRNINRTLLNDINLRYRIQNIMFNSIVDYFMLLVMYLKGFGYSKTELRRLIRDFKQIVDNLNNEIPRSEFNRILGTNIYHKINSINNYV